jgi:hypothetical protein
MNEHLAAKTRFGVVLALGRAIASHSRVGAEPAAPGTNALSRFPCNPEEIAHYTAYLRTRRLTSICAGWSKRFAMNKWQLICPVVAMLAFGMVVAIVATRSQHRAVIQAASLSIGQDLIQTTNSTRLLRVGPQLQAQLSVLLSSPTHVAAVLRGDARRARGDVAACSRIVLTNHAGQRLLVRLAQADHSGMFEVVGFRAGSE